MLPPGLVLHAADRSGNWPGRRPRAAFRRGRLLTLSAIKSPWRKADLSSDSHPQIVDVGAPGGWRSEVSRGIASLEANTLSQALV